MAVKKRHHASLSLRPVAEDFLKVPSRRGERREPYRPPSISACHSMR